MKSNLVKKDKAIIFIWLATCDLTTKTEKYIELTHNTSRYHNKIDAIASKLSTIKAQIQARYKHSRVIILECPPYSIEHYNKYQRHENASKFRSQTLLLESQIFYLNRQIKKINHENFKVCSKIKTKVNENNNTVTQTNVTKKSNSKTSPNFTSDILRQTKQQGQRTRYYVDYKTLYDGLHPDSLIAKLWLRRICQRVVSLCY